MLAGVRDSADLLEAKQPRRAFDRVHGAEDRVDVLAAPLGARPERLQGQQPFVEDADVLGRLVTELAVECGQVHSQVAGRRSRRSAICGLRFVAYRYLPFLEMLYMRSSMSSSVAWGMVSRGVSYTIPC